MRRIEGFIGGKSVKATSGREGDVFNPNTGAQQARKSRSPPPAMSTPP